MCFTGRDRKRRAAATIKVSTVARNEIKLFLTSCEGKGGNTLQLNSISLSASMNHFKQNPYF